MKLLAITLLAVCLIQGNSAQFAGLRNLVSNAQNAVNNAASGAISAASNAAKNIETAASGAVNAATSAASGAVSNALNAANNIRSNLSGGAQALIGSASADASIESLTEAAKKLSPTELVDTVTGAAAEVSARVEAVQEQLEETVNTLTNQAETALESTTSSWNSPVRAVLKKALSAGVDVKDCAVDGVTNLAKDSVTAAVKCVTDKVNEAVTLVKNIAGLPKRAATLAKNGVTAVKECNAQSGLRKTLCNTTKVAPVAVKSALLVKDTVSYTTQAFTLVSTIQTQLSTCAAGVAAKSAAQAATTGVSIVSCVSGKLTAN